MHDNCSQDTDKEDDHTHIQGNKENIKENTTKMNNTEYDEGAQYKEAHDIEQTTLQQEIEMELEKKEDIQHQWTKEDKRKKQQNSYFCGTL
eukprot:11857381-Ditylum_brightwellii.AAC.1